MHPPYVIIHKSRGETPLAAVEAWKREHPELASLRTAYAGRLDPMAEGSLLVLLGDECKKQDTYTGLDKEYEIEVVLDLSTDTGDALGLSSYEGRVTHPTTLKQALRAVTGTRLVPYPAFSSKTVGGKQLFQYALEGTLDTIRIPEHEETVYRIGHLKTAELATGALRERIEDALRVVPRSDEPSKVLGADFRQDAVRAAWRSLFEVLPERTFTVLTLRVASASGTYMRTLSGRIAQEFGTQGFALSICRTRIGAYRKLGPLGYWREL